MELWNLILEVISAVDCALPSKESKDQQRWLDYEKTSNMMV